MATDDVDAGVAGRLAAIVATCGSADEVFGEGFLDRLREDWLD